MTQRRKLISIGLGIFALVAVAVFLLLMLRKPRPVDYRVGAVLSLTGRGGTYGHRALNGMRLALEELNATEPFRDRPIRLVVEDSQSSASQALSGFRKLIDFDHVPVAIGFVLSDEVLTCAPVANERKVVILSTAAGSDEIRDAGDYIFRNREGFSLQTDALAHACVERQLKEVAILHSNAANGISYRDSFRRALEQLGGSVPLAAGYNEGKTDYRAEIEQLRTAAPRAVFLAGLDQEIGLILKQARDVGFSPQFFASAGAISQKALEIAGEAAEGLICASAPFDAASPDPRLRTFAKAFTARFGDPPDFIAANSYDAIYMLASLFKNDAEDSEQIKAGLYGIKDFPGIGGVTTFDQYGEVAKPITLVVVRGGRFVPLGAR